MSKRPASRRSFCVAAGAGLVALGIPGCDPGAARVAIGGLDSASGGPGRVGGGDAGPGQDAGGNPPLDFSTTANPDLASTGSTDMAGSCGGPLNAGPASAITTGQAKHLTDNTNYDLFLCRDSGGLYALSAICTHAGCEVSHQSTQFFCPCHGATFDLNGQNPTSPAFSPLVHYALCIDGSGNVLIDYNTTVAPTTRA